MTSQELVKQAKRIMENADSRQAIATLVEAREFLRIYAGEKSSFLESLSKVNQIWPSDRILPFIIEGV